MRLKPLVALTVGSVLLTACSQAPVKSTATVVNKTPIVFNEPEVTPPFYALNPIDYTQPSEFEINLHKAKTEPVQKLQIKDPNNALGSEIILDKNRFIIPISNSKDKAMRFGVLAQDNELDVTDIDDFLNLLEGKARHYPVRFSSKREREGFTSRLKAVMATLDPLALKTNASYDVLLRAAKASSMARNLDMGEQYGPKALNYAKKLLALKPNDPTISFWLGFGLSEGGAFKEATPYLKAAIDAGIQEAYLSMANNYIFLEQKKNALTTLKNYKVKFPDEADVVDALVKEIQNGKRYNVWQVMN